MKNRNLFVSEMINTTFNGKHKKINVYKTCQKSSIIITNTRNS